MRVQRSAKGVAFVTLGAVLLVTTPGRAQGPALTSDQSLTREILAELIAINTTHDHGNTTPAALAMARRPTPRLRDCLATLAARAGGVPAARAPHPRDVGRRAGHPEHGATDGLYLRNAGMPVYGVSGVVLDADDIRAHGRDERILVREYYAGAEFT